MDIHRGLQSHDIGVALPHLKRSKVVDQEARVHDVVWGRGDHVYNEHTAVAASPRAAHCNSNLCFTPS